MEYFSLGKLNSECQRGTLKLFTTCLVFQLDIFLSVCYGYGVQIRLALD